jgi:hypothetical protein
VSSWYIGLLDGSGLGSFSFLRLLLWFFLLGREHPPIRLVRYDLVQSSKLLNCEHYTVYVGLLRLELKCMKNETNQLALAQGLERFHLVQNNGIYVLLRDEPSKV